MGGIINYYHGERGRVINQTWIVGDEALTYSMRLEGNPHRICAYDYGTDIGIDPQLGIGDTAIYTRLDGTCGIWTAGNKSIGLETDNAVARVLENRQYMTAFSQHGTRGVRDPVQVADDLLQNISVPVLKGDQISISENPVAEISFFLSYSSRNILLAREVYEDVRMDAKVDVWFDLAKPGEAPTHQEHLEQWLQKAIYDSKGYVLLLTRSSADSGWVRKELEWAKTKADRDPAFHLIILKLDDTSVPESPQGAKVIDCRGLWPPKGVNEELYGAIYNRQPWRRWFESHRRQGGLSGSEGSTLTYMDFESDSGVTTGFRWDQKKQSWELRYERDSVQREVRGAGRYQPVDLGIRTGDHVGFFVCRRRMGTHVDRGVPLWMRSGDLKIASDQVLNAYYDAIGLRGSLVVTGRRLLVSGTDTYGRRLSELQLRTDDEVWRGYDEFVMIDMGCVHTWRRNIKRAFWQFLNFFRGLTVIV